MENNRREELIAALEKKDIPADVKRTLISSMSRNESPDDLNPLIDQYPLHLTNNTGVFVKDMISDIIYRARCMSGLKDVYGGYVLIEPPFDSFSTIGLTSLVGMTRVINGEVENDINLGKKIILGYIAIPVDNSDALIENPSINDWEFQERYLDPLLNCDTIPIGSIGMKAIGRKNEEDILRTLKFTMDINSYYQ